MITELIEPTPENEYRQAQLRPMERVEDAMAPMTAVRDRLEALLRVEELHALDGLDTMLEWVDHDEIPTRALIELIAFRTVQDSEMKYRLLAEADPYRRAEIVFAELEHLAEVVGRSRGQSQTKWPKGMSWN